MLVAPQQVVGQWQSHPGIEVRQLHRKTFRQKQERTVKPGGRAASSSCSSRASSRASTVALTFCCPEDSSTRTVRDGPASGNDGRGSLRTGGLHQTAGGKALDARQRTSGQGLRRSDRLLMASKKPAP